MIFFTYFHINKNPSNFKSPGTFGCQGTALVSPNNSKPGGPKTACTAPCSAKWTSCVPHRNIEKLLVLDMTTKPKLERIWFFDILWSVLTLQKPSFLTQFHSLHCTCSSFNLIFWCFLRLSKCSSSCLQSRGLGKPRTLGSAYVERWSTRNRLGWGGNLLNLSSKRSPDESCKDLTVNTFLAHLNTSSQSFQWQAWEAWTAWISFPSDHWYDWSKSRKTFVPKASSKFTMPNSLVWWKWLTRRVWECLPCKIKTSIQNLSRQIKKRVVFCNICLVLAPDFLPHSSGLSPKRTRHPSFADPFLAGNVASVLDEGFLWRKIIVLVIRVYYCCRFKSSFLGK